jgi:hypothetical protein
MNSEDLKKILDNHKLRIEKGYGFGELANLQGADLQGANLRSADLRSADLRSADLRSANLRSADLQGADLRSANLRSADLQGADLQGANLQGADLYGANLQGADLYGADLYGADLQGAEFDELQDARLSILPSDGDVVGWKKCRGGVLVKLIVREGVPRSNATGRKCRAAEVEVIEVDGAKVGVSDYDETTEYRVGKTVKCDTWGENRWQECTGGIHFFITRKEAEVY